MFIVRCPLPFLWHPNVHHSLSLLRLLRKKHSLEIYPLDGYQRGDFTALPSYVGQYITVLESNSIEPTSSLSVVYQPDHIFFFSGIALGTNYKSELPSYLGAVSVAEQIIHSTESFLVALERIDVEHIRRHHARLLSLVEKLEGTLEGVEKSGDNTVSLSTAPLFSTLKFLIEEGGLLLSAFPNISAGYKHLLSSSQDIKKNILFVDQSLEGFYSKYGRGTDYQGHPLRGFLTDIHHRLSSYNTCFEESITKGVVGDGGALKSRVSGGRFGVQSIHSTTPWTRKNIPLRSSF